MKIDLLVKILELLEKAYPIGHHANKLSKEAGFDGHLDGEFHKAIEYLYESRKIHITFEDMKIAHRNEELARRLPSPFAETFKVNLFTIPLQKNDKIRVNTIGIDFLHQLKKERIEEKKNQAILLFSYILAVSAFIQAIIITGIVDKDVLILIFIVAILIPIILYYKNK